MDILKEINANGGLWSFLSILIIILGFVTGFFKKAWDFVKKVKRNFQAGYRLPRETLKIIVQPHSSFWNLGEKQVGKRKKKVMHLGCDLYLTNLTRGDILVTSTYMKKPSSEPTIPMVQASDSDYYGRYPIPPGITTEGRFTYFVDEVIYKRGTNIIGDISVIDQLGNEHIIKNIKFLSR